MSLNTVTNRNWAISIFPKLISDEKFEIKSPCDDNYNCIAFTNGKNNIWWWPFPKLDGVCEWPIPEVSMHYTTLIKLFESKGFSICSSHDFDPKYLKVALYVDLNDDFTHASRQCRDGLWKSKLGKAFDIIHENPFSIENTDYGDAKIFMQAKY